MINKRKKRKDVKDSFINEKQSFEQSSGGLLGSTYGDGALKTMRTGNFGDDTGDKRRLGKRYDAQVATIQEASDDRAAAEESNLDILDRGSRYTRQNKKLKKFKDTQNGKK